MFFHDREVQKRRHPKHIFPWESILSHDPPNFRGKCGKCAKMRNMGKKCGKKAERIFPGALNGVDPNACAGSHKKHGVCNLYHWYQYPYNKSSLSPTTFGGVLSYWLGITRPGPSSWHSLFFFSRSVCVQSVSKRQAVLCAKLTPRVIFVHMK
jgi:hypothetical protein